VEGREFGDGDNDSQTTQGRRGQGKEHVQDGTHMPGAQSFNLQVQWSGLRMRDKDVFEVDITYTRVGNKEMQLDEE